ncbi:MAG: hypothetical protein HYR91_13555 [Flavobacteriia bacterium]|nr:hypothetical protein [Flavobacteriia bacterium]
MKYIFYLIIAVFLASCGAMHQTISTQNTNDTLLYREAIANSIYPEPSKIDSNLVAINSGNPNLIWKTIQNEKYILVVTWKQNVSYYKDKLDTLYNTGKYPIWITTAPQLKTRFQQEKVEDTNKRLLQLLGLPPNATYSYFVEFWVKPQDLFRPCPDKEISDKQCETCFPKNTDSTHISWINENRISRYYQCELFNQYPWTQLGYTFDWSPLNTSHIGLSEFVIGANKSVYVKAIYTTSEYLDR